MKRRLTSQSTSLSDFCPMLRVSARDVDARQHLRLQFSALLLALCIIPAISGCSNIIAQGQEFAMLDCGQATTQLSMARSFSGRDVIEDARAELLARCLDARAHADDENAQAAGHDDSAPAPLGEAWLELSLVGESVLLPRGATLPLPPGFARISTDASRGTLGPTHFAVLELSGLNDSSLSLAVQQRTDAPMFSGFRNSPHPLPRGHALFERGELEAEGLRASWCVSFTRTRQAVAMPTKAAERVGATEQDDSDDTVALAELGEPTDPVELDGPSAADRPEDPESTGGRNEPGSPHVQAKPDGSSGIMAFGATFVLSREARLVLAVTAPLPSAHGAPPAGLLLDDARFAAVDGFAADWKRRVRGWLLLLSRRGKA